MTRVVVLEAPFRSSWKGVLRAFELTRELRLKERARDLLPGSCAGVPRPCDPQACVSANRHLSRIFPASLGHSRRRFSHALQHIDVLLRPRGRPPGLGFQGKISLRLRPLRGEIFPRSLHRKHISALGVGRLASLRARVSRGQYGQIQTGEMQWHSTKTRSL